MAHKETVYRDGGSNLQTIALVVLGVVVVALLAWIVYQANARASLLTDKEDRIRLLKDDSTQFEKKLEDLRDKEVLLTEQREELLARKEELITERDSVARLLAYSRANERNAQAKVAQLQKRLNELTTQLSDVQKKYDDLLASSGAATGDFRRQVEALTAERNALAVENQRLQQELSNALGNADNRTAIFSTFMSATPGEIKRGQFSASRRSQNTDRIEVSFTLSRPPKPTENLIFKVFDNVNTEIPIKPLYRNELNAPADPINQKVILEFETGYLSRRTKGPYTVRLYLTDVNKGLENQEIGLTTMDLK